MWLIVCLSYVSVCKPMPQSTYVPLCGRVDVAVDGRALLWLSRWTQDLICVILCLVIGGVTL